MTSPRRDWSDADLLRYLDGQCPRTEIESLQRDLIASPDLALRLANLSRFETQMRLAQQLRVSDSMAMLIQELETRPKARRSYSLYWIGGSVAVLLIATLVGRGIFFFTKGDPNPDTPPLPNATPILAQVIRGEVQVNGRTEKNVPLDQVFSTSAPVMIEFADGSRCEIAEASQAQFVTPKRGKRPNMKLIEGRGTFTIRPGEEPFQVQTSVGDITVLGTEFEVEIGLYKERNMPIRQLLFVAVTTGLVSVNVGGITEKLSGGQSAAYGEEKPARDAVVTGKVKAVDAEKKTITLAGKEGDGGKVTPEQTFTLGDGLKVTINGKAGKLDEIKAKMDVRLVLSADKKSVTEIQTRVGGDGEKPVRPLKGFRGEVSKVDDKSITVTAKGDGGGRSETFPLEGAKIMIETNEDIKVPGEGGREVTKAKVVEGKVSDIKAGQIVTLSIKEDKLTSVTVARKPKDGEKKSEK